MEESGFQFVHIEGYSRKADARGRSVDFVLSEAERQQASCAHIIEPCPPELIFGRSLVELRNEHDTRAATATVSIAGGKTRRIRLDQLTLLTVVTSHPATVAEARENPAVGAEVKLWEERVVSWLLEQWGENLASVVRHVDERHAHLHAYILPNDGDMRARRLHPGVAAKELTKETAAAEGSTAKAANAAGDKAYCSAMRAMQDEYWQSVGIPSALARLGPGRRRLTRAEWHAERAGVAATAEVLRVAEVARTGIETARQEAAIVTLAAGAQRAAAESLEAQAAAAANRARVAVRLAREQAIEAKAEILAARTERAEAAHQSRLLAARGRRLVEQARGEAKRLLDSAHAEAGRVRRSASGIGAWFGSLVLGLCGVAPAMVARNAAAVARAEEQVVAAERAALSRIVTERAQRQLHETEIRLAAASDAAASLGAQRDRMARELNRLRPASIPTVPTRTPTPTRRPR